MLSYAVRCIAHWMTKGMYGEMKIVGAIMRAKIEMLLTYAHIVGAVTSLKALPARAVEMLAKCASDPAPL